MLRANRKFLMQKFFGHLLQKKTLTPAITLLLTTACSSFHASENAARGSRGQHPTHLRCLAQAIHGEARGEAEEGKLLVGRVIATRVHYGYGKNYCEVVNAKRQFAPQKNFNSASMAAAKKSHSLGPNGITHFHSYTNRTTPKASFSMSPQCKYKGKVGGHWTFACNERRMLSSVNEDED